MSFNTSDTTCRFVNMSHVSGACCLWDWNQLDKCDNYKLSISTPSIFLSSPISLSLLLSRSLSPSPVPISISTLQMSVCLSLSLPLSCSYLYINITYVCHSLSVMTYIILVASWSSHQINQRHVVTLIITNLQIQNYVHLVIQVFTRFLAGINDMK